MRIVWNKDDENPNGDDDLTPEQLEAIKEHCMKNYLKDPETFKFLLDVYPEFKDLIK